MSNSIEELAERVSYLEREMRRTARVIDGIEKESDTRFQAIEKHLDRHDQRFDHIDEQFKHVYGMLADIQANNAEVRNILAVIVAKLG
jgi:predicted  nucleic acid-binding Zn-ribbon protein